MEWISVKDRLPKKEEFVAVSCMKHNEGNFRLRKGIAIGIWMGVYFVDMPDNCGCNGVDPKDVTHWMPLPEPPKD